ncbi:MAG: DNA polymerase III subunit gamma/tau [Acidobacteriaceae bacterium]
MAYQVLARKYRPQQFSDVAGQDHVTRTLMNALTQGRIAHGYIFSGHRGIGKTTIARILAMALNCQLQIGSAERPTAEPCGTCVSCTEIRAGNAVDVIEIDAATNRGIDEIRELRDAARYRPARDRYKIYILDEAHQITDAAFNALLKTLEEPPDHVVFMMATTQPEDFPQTIRSRCQHFSFHAVKLDDILSELRGIAEREGILADDTALSLLAEAGDGSMRDALSIMDQAIASAPVQDGKAVLDAAQILDLMGTVPNVVFEQMLEAVSGNQTDVVLTEANRLLDAGNSPAQLARQFVRYLRNCLIAKIANITPENDATELLQISPDERKRAARSAMLFTEEDLARFLQVMLRTFDELGYRQEQRFHFELGLVKLVHLQRLLPVEELLSQVPLPASSRPAAAPRVAAPAPRPATPAAAPSAPCAVAPPPVASAAPAFSPFEADRERKITSETTSRPPVASVSAEPRTETTNGSLALAAVAEIRPEPAAALEPAPVAIIEPEHVPVAESVVEVQAPAASAPMAAATESGLDAEALQNAVCDALAANGQQSASDQLGESTWSIENGQILVQTAMTKTLIGLIFTTEAEKIAKEALRANNAGALKLTLLPGDAAARKTKKARAPRSGSVQAKAMEHPLVQQAQSLFNAEIRNVIDLRKDD